MGLRPFVNDAFAIATRFRIRSDELLESRELRIWKDTLIEKSENALTTIQATISNQTMQRRRRTPLRIITPKQLV